MPSKNTLFILIVCFGIVVSTYLLTKNPTSSSITQNVNGVSTNPYINLGKNTSNDWQKILSDVDLSKSTTTILSAANPDLFDDTTLTAQMSRDFLSQYLLSIKDGYSSNDSLTNNILSSPTYKNLSGAKYIASNLRVINKSDPVTLQNYEDAVNLILKEKSLKITEDPVRIFQDAVNSASETKIAKLDPIIATNKAFIVDFLNMNVPEKAVPYHLSLLNASSNILADLEAFRVVFSDPVRSLTALSQHTEHRLKLANAVDGIAKFFAQN